MKQFYSSLLFMLCAYILTTAQTTTITVSTGPDFTDATLIKSLKSSESGMANTNYNGYPRLASTAWTHSGVQITYRTLLKFDLSGVPAGTTVQSATLYLYSDPANTTGEIGNDKASGSNAYYLQKVTQAWTPTSVTWNTQPATTTTGRVWVNASSTSTDNITVDVKSLVQDMVNNPTSNHGLLMKLENEVYYRSRSYASTNHMNPSLHPRLVVVLSTPMVVSNDYLNMIEPVFQNLNRAPVTTGLLADYSLMLTNINNFGGIRNDSNYLVYSEWQAIYSTLYSGQFNNNINLAQPGTVFDLVDNLTVQNVGNKLIVGLHYRFERFREDAVSANLVYINNNQIYDTPNRSASPYEQRDCFGIAPKFNVLNGASHNFLFKPELFYSNTGKTISSIQFDAGDGLGYQPLALNTPRSVLYDTNGVKTFRFKITYTDNSAFESHSKVLVQEIPASSPVARVALAQSVDPPLLFTSTKLFQAPGESQPKAAKAKVTIAFAGTDRNIRKPFIVAEGFDPWKITHEGDESWNFSYRNFIEGRGSNLGINREMDYTTPSDARYSTLEEAIYKEGFDIIFIDFEDATDYMERNAYVVEEVIKWVNLNKQPYNGVIQKNVVAGLSMGGMVALCPA